MADNIVISSGQTTRTDDLAGIHYPVVKWAIGADGAAVMVEPPDGDAKAATAMVAAGQMAYNGATWDRARSASADTLAATGVSAANPVLYNGATFDRQRGNHELTLLASAARTATTASTEQTNHSATGIAVWINVTVAATGSVTLRLYGRPNPANSAGQVQLATTAAFTSTGPRVLYCYPGATSTDVGANVARVVSLALPRTWLIEVAHADGSSWTYEVRATVIV